MTNVIGIDDIMWDHRLTGPHRDIQASQDPCENLKQPEDILQHVTILFFHNTTQKKHNSL